VEVGCELAAPAVLVVEESQERLQQVLAIVHGFLEIGLDILQAVGVLLGAMKSGRSRRNYYQRWVA